MTEPQIIGDVYAIDDLLGQGGMATVFAGRDIRSDMPVAIKRLKPEIIALDPDIVERFEREGEALRRLNHPNIVKVLATVKTPDAHYVVMELVAGGDLRGVLDDLRGREALLPVKRVLEIALDLSDALARAHRLKIVHRDLKPANVLMAEDGTPRLTDFGVAHFSDSTRMTQTGMIVGTLAYLSPESCMGMATDTRSDIWSFGVMLYEMLTLQRPFDADNSAALINGILSREPAPITDLRPDCPPALNTLVLQMLAKDRDERISSVRSVGARVEAMLTGRSIPTDSAPTPTPTNPNDSALRWPQVPHDVDTGEFLPGEKAETRDKAHVPAPISSSRRPASSSGTSTRILSRQPRIFISYRREDNSAIVGRLYDRLLAAFGENNVFKDVDDIPLGVDFKQALQDEIERADVLLVVIGRQWLQAVDTNNLRRLDDPNDFVRIEVEAALSREGVLIVPVLLQGAAMPTSADLPEGMQGLIYRNAATLRNEPDFNRDAEWIIAQIRGALQGAGAGSISRRMLMGAVVGAVALMLLAALLFSGVVGDDPGGGDPVQAGPLQAMLNPDAITVVEAVPADTYMVLVAEFEQLGTTPQAVSQFITEDLRQKFEQDVPFSSIVIRQSQDVVRNSAEALMIAEANEAIIVVWGNYDDAAIDVYMEVGSLARVPGSVYTRTALSDIADVRLSMSNPRRESVVASVIAIANIIASANSDAYDIAQNLATLEVALPVSPAVVGNGAAENWHRYLMSYFDDPQEALGYIEAVLAVNQHPIYYLGVTLAYQKVGQFELVPETAQTAARLGPDNWALPYITLGQHSLYFDNDLEVTSEYLNQAAANNDTWYLNMLRGGVYLLLNDDESALPLLEAAIAADPPMNWPYALAATIALRQSRIVDAGVLVRRAEEKLINPDYASLLLRATYGQDTTTNALVISLEAFSTFSLRQWQATLDIIETSLAQDDPVPDLYLLQGIAYCNLEDYPAAESSYTTLLDLMPTYTAAYALRAEVRLRQGKGLDALADVRAINGSVESSQFEAVIPLVQAGTVNCTNILEADLESLTQVENE